jgi:hypothetical protein
MKASVGRVVEANFSMWRRYFTLAGTEAHQPPREDRAELVAPLGGRHAFGVEGVRTSEGNGIEHHDPSMPDRAGDRDLGTGDPAPVRRG